MTESVLQVAVIMGSKSDWDTMRLTSETLAKLDIVHEYKVLSAHRAPDALLTISPRLKLAAFRYLSQVLEVRHI